MQNFGDVSLVPDDDRVWDSEIVMGRKVVVAVVLSFLLLSAAYFSHVSKFSFRTFSRTRASQESHSPPEVHLDSAVNQSAAQVHDKHVYALVAVKDEEVKKDPGKGGPGREVVHPRLRTLSQATDGPRSGSTAAASPSGATRSVSTVLPTQNVVSPPYHHWRQANSESLKFRNFSTPSTLRTASVAALQGTHNDNRGTAYKDALCKEYLSEEDRQRFRECTSRVSGRGKPLKNGACRFMDGTARPKVALASFPGSGNTWVRGLLETATGLCTGAIYCDSVLRSSGFNGENVVGSSVLAVKTHSDLHDFQAAIHLVRSPDNAIVSEWNRHTGFKGAANGGGRHTAVASPDQFGESQEWDTFLHEYFRRWAAAVKRTATFQQKWPVLRVFYEDLKVNATHEVERMLDFLDIPYSRQELELRLRNGFQKLHRQHGNNFNPFTADQYVFLKLSLYQLDKELRKQGFEDSADFVHNYI